MTEGIEEIEIMIEEIADQETKEEGIGTGMMIEEIESLIEETGIMKEEIESTKEEIGIEMILIKETKTEIDPEIIPNRKEKNLIIKMGIRKKNTNQLKKRPIIKWKVKIKENPKIPNKETLKKKSKIIIFIEILKAENVGKNFFGFLLENQRVSQTDDKRLRRRLLFLSV